MVPVQYMVGAKFLALYEIGAKNNHKETGYTCSSDSV